MKKFIINKFLNIIRKHYNYDNIKLSEIKYGLEILYLTITKTIVIFFIAYLIGTFKELLLLVLFYGLLRMSGFGLHAKESWQCWLGSIISFIGFSYLSSIIIIPFYLKIIIIITTIITLIIYAPADTEKRPLVNKKRRVFFKIFCILTSFSYGMIILKSNNNTINNILIFSLIIESFMVLPISYKVFKLKYRNYRSYQKKYT